ncbi:hypothetical protein [Thiobacillus sp.]
MTDKKKGNGWGGARPGAGRKPKPPCVTAERDPLEFLLDVMQGKVAANLAQVKAAIAAAPYVHPKKGESGKKEEAAAIAKKAAAGGKFAPSKVPNVVMLNRGQRPKDEG